MRREVRGASGAWIRERHCARRPDRNHIIIFGGGTLVTGGRIVNGRRSAPESQVTRVLNGPSCSGVIAIDDMMRKVVKVGDIIIIPAGVPYGRTEIGDHVDYLSVRPDPDRVIRC